MGKKYGFTLMELLAVVIVIGVLATFAVPGFSKMKERTYEKSAKTMLSLIFEEEKKNKLLTGNYIGCSDTNKCENDLYLELADRGVWNYSVAISPDLIVKATRVGAGATVFCINESIGTDILSGLSNCT